MKCNERFIKVDPPNLQFISKFLASLYYLLSVNFCLESFFFDWKGIPARTLFIIHIATKFMMPSTSFWLAPLHYRPPLLPYWLD